MTPIVNHNKILLSNYHFKSVKTLKKIITYIILLNNYTVLKKKKIKYFNYYNVYLEKAIFEIYLLS